MKGGESMKITTGIFKHPAGVLKVTESRICFRPNEPLKSRNHIEIFDWFWTDKGFDGTGTLLNADKCKLEEEEKEKRSKKES